jgi:hypothetical protein
MKSVFRALFCIGVLAIAFFQHPSFAQVSSPPGPASASTAPLRPQEFGIAVKRPVFAGACKACPWGILASVTQQALKPYGYDVQICWVCASTDGPRYMSDKTVPVMPRNQGGETAALIEPPPPAVPDISGTTETNLLDAWNWTGPFVTDRKDSAPVQRRNFKVIAVVQQPNYLMAAANKRSGITNLAQIKDRTRPTWIVMDRLDGRAAAVMTYYGITEELLKSHGGGFLPGGVSREMRATADVWVGGGLLVDTPEQRMWYEISQLSDLVFLDLDEALLNQLAQKPGYVRSTLPLAFLRGVDRPIPTVMRSANYIYVRSDAPESFTYIVAKALDEHQDLFETQMDPFWYDPKRVATTISIPMAAGALKYYRERGYIK